MARGSKRHVREAEEKAFEANKRLTQAHLEAVQAHINLAVEKLRVLRDKLPECNEREFDDIICDLRGTDDSIRNTIIDLKKIVLPTTRNDKSDHNGSGSAPAGNLFVKREPEDGAAGN